ncbi:MAG: hypothetical protein JRJ29_19385 [Deltaproteobacteria bacterium]|nr:hypothetical protein [Deltaproteobacteria bacterium]
MKFVKLDIKPSEDISDLISRLPIVVLTSGLFHVAVFAVFVFFCLSRNQIPLLPWALLVFPMFGLFLLAYTLLSRPYRFIEQVHPKSFLAFLEACNAATEGVFLNAQVSLHQWFNPWSQVHLALQDSAAHSKRLQYLFTNKTESNSQASNPGDCCPYFPFRRILLANLEKEHLWNGRGRDWPDGLLKAFSDIHCLMASPLAVCSIDFLAQIMEGNPVNAHEGEKNLPAGRDVLVEEEKWKTYCGLGEQTVGICTSYSTRQRGDTVSKMHRKLKPSLKHDLKRMKLKRGKSSPSIDCAVLYATKSSVSHVSNRLEQMNSDSKVRTLFESAWLPCGEDQMYSVWRADLTVDGMLIYWPVTKTGMDELKNNKIKDPFSPHSADEAATFLKRFVELLDQWCFAFKSPSRVPFSELRRNSVLHVVRMNEQSVNVKLPVSDCDPFNKLDWNS